MLLLLAAVTSPLWLPIALVVAPIVALAGALPG